MKPADGSSDPTLTPSQPRSDAPTPALADTAVDDPGRSPPGPARASIAVSPASYELGELLGRGGMGEVVLAHDPRIGRQVALKRLRLAVPGDDAVARFLREARIQARLEHPAIVPIYELGQDAAGLPYFTMKRLAGVTLHERITDTDTPTVGLLRAFVDVCLAIELAHTRGIVHRDLKPSNVMTGDFGEVYVLDWGLARILDDQPDKAAVSDLAAVDSHTQVGALLGTPGYMAPEQARGEPAGPPADVYALGAILFEILTREPVHPRGIEGIASALEGGVHSPANRAPARAIPPELDAVCVAALDDAPDQRPSARVLADRVQRYLDGDRDLERRRVLAAEQLSSAEVARAEGRRADAIRAAGRAMALDPESAAAELVTSLLVEPPRPLPPELVAEVEAEEHRLGRQRSRRSIVPYLMGLLVLPLVPFIEVASWPLLIVLVGASVGMAGLAWLSSRAGRDGAGTLLLGNLGLVLLASRLNGPFAFLPLILGFMLLAMGAHATLAARPLRLVAWAIIATLAPFVLEELGVFASTWQMRPDGLWSWGTIVTSRTTPVAVAIIGANLMLAIGIGLFSISTTRDRRDAQANLQIQAWQLRQLLPKRATYPSQT